MHTIFRSRKLAGRNNSEELWIEWKIILKRWWKVVGKKVIRLSVGVLGWAPEGKIMELPAQKQRVGNILTWCVTIIFWTQSTNCVCYSVRLCNSTTETEVTRRWPRSAVTHSEDQWTFILKNGLIQFGRPHWTDNNIGQVVTGTNNT